MSYSSCHQIGACNARTLYALLVLPAVNSQHLPANLLKIEMMWGDHHLYQNYWCHINVIDSFFS